MSNFYSVLADLHRDGVSHVLVTVIEAQGHSPAKIGAKMAVMADNHFEGTVGGGALEKRCQEIAADLLKRGESTLKNFHLADPSSPIESTMNSTGAMETTAAETTGMICGGRVMLFFEYVPAQKNVCIFGAGHIGRALIHHLHPLNLRLTLYDDRPAILEKLQLPEDVTVELYDPEQPPCTLPPQAMAVVASYSHDNDYRILRALLMLPEPPVYIGVVASRKKRDLFFSKLEEDFASPPDTERIFAPCGLNIGTRDPHEIAVAISAEILALQNRNGPVMHMRDR